MIWPPSLLGTLLAVTVLLVALVIAQIWRDY